MHIAAESMNRISFLGRALPGLLLAVALLLIGSSGLLGQEAAPTSAENSVEAPISFAPEAVAPEAAIPQGAPESAGAEEPGDLSVGETTSAPGPRDGQAEKLDSSTAAAASSVGYWPLVILAIGIVTVLGLIIGFKLNAFLALIIAAILVSVLAPGSLDGKISRVASSFGSAAGNIAIVIGMAAIIGKCMLDSGAADRIVRAFVGLLGPKRSSLALMLSGFVLAIPVFFDTVFYLLVPLARSLHRRTGKEYLKYLMAIAGGGAITHTLVPPTPGPLLMAAILNVDFGLMIIVGMMVAFPAAVVGLIFSSLVDRWKPIEMRPSSGEGDLAPPSDDKLPGLIESMLPVLLPVVLIAVSTVAVTLADREDAAALRSSEIKSWSGWSQQLNQQLDSDTDNPGKWLLDHSEISSETRSWWLQGEMPTAEQEAVAIDELNQVLRNRETYRESAFLGLSLPGFAKSKVTADNSRMKPVEVSRMNRELLETAYPEQLARHNWNTSAREFAGYTLFFGNANFALLLSCGIAMVTLVRTRSMTREQLALAVESALMSAGVIILITAAGAAFGDMLQTAQIGPAIKERFSSVDGASAGIGALLLGFTIAAVLKVAQGSSTVAMIVGAGMMLAIVDRDSLGFHPVYLATAIGSGSLVGSWMNDSGFWIFAKMGGLTEGEALRSWTPLLVVLAFTGLIVSIVLALIMPMAS